MWHLMLFLVTTLDACTQFFSSGQWSLHYVTLLWCALHCFLILNTLSFDAVVDVARLVDLLLILVSY